MNYYFDIQVIPDAEMRQNILLNKVFMKLHKILCDLKSNKIGVSFPNHKITLGRTLRIHSEFDQLEQLIERGWLGGLSGYCRQSNISPIPAKVEYQIISRVQQNMTNAKLRRLIKRGSIEHEQIKEYKVKMFSKGLSEPFLELESNSNQHKYRCYVQFSEIKEKQQSGTFDRFGFSKTATVPIF